MSIEYQMVYSLRNKDGVPLEKLLDDFFGQKREGFFVELGANDGVSQSNTAFLEQERGWTGVLIEPSLQGFEQCKLNRPKAKLFRCACVSKTYAFDQIEGDFSSCHLMASIGGTRCKSDALCLVPARTLDSVLEEAQCPAQFDLLSLDVEGYELEVLRGLTLQQFRPRALLIEVYTKDYEEIVKHLGDNGYALQCNLSGYTKETKPDWDGTHNDYLFLDTTR